MDLYFVVETSNPDSLEDLESVMKAIGNHFRIKGPNTRVGVITFDDDARVEIPLKAFQNNTAFQTATLLSNRKRGKVNTFTM